MKQTINELSKLLRPDNNFTGDYSFYGVVQSAIIDSDNKVTGYNVRVGESLIEARKLAGAQIGDVVLCTTLSNGVTVISGTLDGDKDAVHAGELAEETNNYFWFTSSNTGFGKGAHITQKTQAEVLADPTNAGGNVLIDSDSLDVRDGENVLATFSAEETRIGSEDGSNLRLNNRGLVAKKSDGSEYFNVGLIGSESQFASVEDYSDYSYNSSHRLDLGDEWQGLYDSIADGATFTLYATVQLEYRVEQSGGQSWWQSWSTSLKHDFTKGTAGSFDGVYFDFYYDRYLSYDSVSVRVDLTKFRDNFPNGYRLVYRSFRLGAYINTTAPSYSFGINTDVSKKLGFAIGNGTIPSECGFACGKYNEVDNDDEYALIVGNGDENSPSNALSLSWGGDLTIAGQHQALYKITTVAVETGSIDADSYKSSQNYPMTEESGYNAVGIVGWSTSNWRIQPTSHYIVSNTQIYAGFANYKSPPSSGTSSASATITFRVLWLKATSA